MGIYITATELRAHVPGLSLSDAVLDDIIDDIEEQIVDNYGATGVDVVERFVPGSDLGPIVLGRKPDSITSIVEELDAVASTTRTLAADDYRLRGYLIQRLRGGTNPAYGWAWHGVVVTYRPKDDSVRRKMAIVDVAKEEIAAGPYQSETIGEYSYSKGSAGQAQQSSEARRIEILRVRLAPKGGLVMA